MNSKEIKRKLIHYYRFTRRFFWCATETGYFNMDVAVANDESIIEIEVKISKADLKNDKKKRKHRIYKELKPYYRGHVPNKFYYAVPSFLVQLALEETKDSNYGVLEIIEGEETFKKSKVKIVKRAKTLHTFKNSKLRHCIFLRMGSEVECINKITMFY